MEADDLLCSRNARPKKALVGRAQWKINQPPSPKRYRASLDGLLMRAVEGSLGHSSREVVRMEPHGPGIPHQVEWRGRSRWDSCND